MNVFYVYLMCVLLCFAAMALPPTIYYNSDTIFSCRSYHHMLSHNRAAELADTDTHMSSFAFEFYFMCSVRIQRKALLAVYSFFFPSFFSTSSIPFSFRFFFHRTENSSVQFWVRALYPFFSAASILFIFLLRSSTIIIKCHSSPSSCCPLGFFFLLSFSPYRSVARTLAFSMCDSIERQKILNWGLSDELLTAHSVDLRTWETAIAKWNDRPIQQQRKR